jgi:cytochrome P450 family 13
MQETTIGDVKVEEGIKVMADPFTVQYSKELWGEDADEFRPERFPLIVLTRLFSWESSERRHMLAWLPFGAGPRTCIGMRLAYLEEKLALAHLLRNFNLLACPQTEVLIVGS